MASAGMSRLVGHRWTLCARRGSARIRPLSSLPSSESPDALTAPRSGGVGNAHEGPQRFVSPIDDVEQRLFGCLSGATI